MLQTQTETLEQLLKRISKIIQYLSYSINIRCYDQKDLVQMMYVVVLEDHEKYPDKPISFWKVKLRRYLLNVIRKEHRVTLISFDLLAERYGIGKHYYE